jgi:phytoene dehydrogenase-like protein
MLKGPVTPLRGLYLAGDSIFPGIGIPAVALSGANAANSVVSVVRHIREVLRSKDT